MALDAAELPPLVALAAAPLLPEVLVVIDMDDEEPDPELELEPLVDEAEPVELAPEPDAVEEPPRRLAVAELMREAIWEPP